MKCDDSFMGYDRCIVDSRQKKSIKTCCCGLYSINLWRFAIFLFIRKLIFDSIAHHPAVIKEANVYYAIIDLIRNMSD